MSLSTQLTTMLAMVGMGGWVGIALDTYRRLFHRRKRRMWVAFSLDVLFCTVQSVLIFLVLYLINYGEIRFYIFLALLCGYAAYQSLLKDLYTTGLERTLYLLKKLFSFIKRVVTIILIRPILIIGIGIVQIFSWIGTKSLYLARFILRILIYLLIIVFRPFFLFGKFLWNFIPESSRIKVTMLFKTIRKIYIEIRQRLKKK